MEPKTELLDYLLGWWEILYIKDDIQITLSIHAASGQACRARVSMHESSMPVPLYEEGKLLDAAFPFIKADNKQEVVAVEKSSHWKICKYTPGGNVYADVGWGMAVSDEVESLVQLTISLHSVK